MRARETDRIYLSSPHLGGLESRFLKEALDSNWIAPLGPQVDAFEEEFSSYLDVKAAAALVSGTAALHLGLRLVGVGSDDRVLCSTLTFVASANPILYLQAIPVFVDADRSSWNLDPNLLEDELARSARRRRMPRAVVVVDILGQSADWDAISSICDRYGVEIVEDAAEALGATRCSTGARRGWSGPNPELVLGIVSGDTATLDYSGLFTYPKLSSCFFVLSAMSPLSLAPFFLSTYIWSIPLSSTPPSSLTFSDGSLSRSYVS